MVDAAGRVGTTWQYVADPLQGVESFSPHPLGWSNAREAELQQQFSQVSGSMLTSFRDFINTKKKESLKLDEM